jgi:hypothetical protein
LLPSPHDSRFQPFLCADPAKLGKSVHFACIS